MGDSFQIIADVEAPEAEAAALAAAVIGWLSGAGIVGAEQADCVLGAAAGYPPGPCYAAAVTTPDERLLTLRTNGVEVHTNPERVLPRAGRTRTRHLPRCGHRMELEDPPTGAPTAHWEPFNEASTTGNGPGSGRSPSAFLASPFGTGPRSANRSSPNSPLTWGTGLS